MCGAKSDLASLYLMQDRYDDARELIGTLPTMYPYMLNDRMRCSAYRLRGKDRLEGASEWRIIEIQELFIACAMEGEGYFETGEYEKALKSFTESRQVLEMFMKSEKITPDAYLWCGMLTNHWAVIPEAAGALLCLGREDGARAHADWAWYILSHAWGEDFEKGNEFYRKEFRRIWQEYGLDSLGECP